MSKTAHYPIFLDLKGWHCAVIGGGEVASRKVRALLDAGAKVVVISPDLCSSLARWRDEGLIAHKALCFTPECLDRIRLVIAATNDAALNRNVAEIAEERDLLVNVVDMPDVGNFILPAILDRSPVQIAISTGGASPMLARHLKARLETLIPSGYGQLARLLERFRQDVKRCIPEMSGRRRFWETVLQGPVPELVLSGQKEKAAEVLVQTLEDGHFATKGEVYLVGAGPGDPDLLTFRALRLMQQAEVVLYDHLVAEDVLNLVRKEAERIYVGKEKSKHTLPQEQIGQMMIAFAREGKRVLRLKGGDPFIFGRGGEEIATLSDEGIPFQIVPGITAASGCACYAGIPLTHRDYAQSCVFVTGHLKDGSMNLDWEMLARPRQTIVVYMGLQGVEILCRELVRHGLSAVTPVAVVEQGTTPNQRVLISTLDVLPAKVAESSLQPPSLIIIGDCVQLHRKLAWVQESKCL